MCLPLTVGAVSVQAKTIPIQPVNIGQKGEYTFPEPAFSPGYIEGETESYYRGFTNRPDMLYSENYSTGKKSYFSDPENYFTICLKDCQKGKPQVLFKNVGTWKGKEISLVFTVNNWTLLNDTTDTRRGNFAFVAIHRKLTGFHKSTYTVKDLVLGMQLVYVPDSNNPWDFEPVEDDFLWTLTTGDMDGDLVNYNGVKNADGTVRSAKERIGVKGTDYTAYVANGRPGEVYDNKDNKPAIQNKIIGETQSSLPDFTIFTQKADGTYNNGTNADTTIGKVVFFFEKSHIEMHSGSMLYGGGCNRGTMWTTFQKDPLGKFADPVPKAETSKKQVHRNEVYTYTFTTDIPTENSEYYYNHFILKTTLPEEVEPNTDSPFSISVYGSLSEEDKATVAESYTYNAETKEWVLSIPESTVKKAEFYGSEIQVTANVKVTKEVETSPIPLKCTLQTREKEVESNEVSVAVVHEISTSVNGEGGVITPTTTVPNGASHQVIAQAQDGYVISNLLLDGVAVTGIAQNSKQFAISLSDIKDGHTVVAEFAKEPKTTVTKTADKDEYGIGEPISYTIHMANEGESPEDITFEDEMPEGIEVATATANSNKVNLRTTETKVTSDPFPLVGGEAIDIVVTTKPLAETLNGKVSTNTAVIEGSFTGRHEASDDTWVNEPNLYVEKSLDKTKVVEGDKVKYTVTLTQTVLGQLTAKNVVLKDTVQNGAGTIDKSSVEVFVNDSKVEGVGNKMEFAEDSTGYQFNLGTLNNQDTVRIEYLVNVEETAEDKLTNSIEVSSDNTVTKSYTASTDTPIQHKYNIYTSVIGGTITQFTDKVLEGETVEVEYMPNDGQYLYSVSVDGQEVNVQEYLNKVSFTNIQGNHSVHVVYKDIPTTKYHFNKVWKDNDNKNNTRPDSVSVKVTGSNGFEQTYELTKDNNWNIDTQDLPLKQPNGVDITYTGSEVETPNYHSQMTKLNDTYTFTNTVYGEKEVVVNIEWETPDPDTIPNEVEIVLTGNGKSFANKVNTNTTTHQTTSFTVPAYDVDGNEIDYIATENAVKDYTTTYPDKTTVHNKYDPEMKTLTVTKSWLDNNNTYNTRPAQLTFNILRNGLPFTSVSVSAPLWQAEVNVPCSDKSGAEYQYTIEEQEVSGYESKVEEFVATNTLVGLTEKTLHIVYEGVSEENEPETVEVQLKANEKVIQTQTIDKTKEYTFKELPKYDENGTEIVYTVEEVKIGEEEVKNNSTRLFEVNYSEDTFTITNSRKDRKVKCFIEVLWNDYENEDNTRPGTRKGTLTRNDGEVIEFELTKDKEWKVIVEDLESEDETGTPYTYTLSMDGIEKYEDVVKGEFNSYKVVSTYRRQPKPVEEPQAPTEKEEKEEPVKGIPTGVEPVNPWLSVVVVTLVAGAGIILMKKFSK